MPRTVKTRKQLVLLQGSRGRNPFEVLLLVWSIQACLAFFINPETAPGSIETYLRPWMVILWYTLLCVGGLVTLVGVLMRDLVTSLLMERAGMYILFPAALLYAMAIAQAVGARGFVAGTVVGAFSAAALVRIIQIAMELRAIRGGFR